MSAGKRELTIFWTNHRFECTFSSSNERRDEACRPVNPLEFIHTSQAICVFNAPSCFSNLYSSFLHRIYWHHKRKTSQRDIFRRQLISYQHCINSKIQGGRTHTNFEFYKLLSSSEPSKTCRHGNWFRLSLSTSQGRERSQTTKRQSNFKKDEETAAREQERANSCGLCERSWSRAVVLLVRPFHNFDGNSMEIRLSDFLDGFSGKLVSVWVHLVGYLQLPH